MPGQEGETKAASSFAERLSPLIAAAGVVPLPVLLVRHQARLRLTANELVYLLHVLSYRWEGGRWPWLTIQSVADAAGVHYEVARRWRSSLETKGYLCCRHRSLPGVGRRADEHDLSGLFAQLETLAEEEQAQRLRQKMSADLPPRQYQRGIATTPQLPRGRSKKLATRGNEIVESAPNVPVSRLDENAGARSNEIVESGVHEIVESRVHENAGARLDENAGRKRRRLQEPGSENSTVRTQSQELERDNRALAAARPGFSMTETERGPTQAYDAGSPHEEPATTSSPLGELAIETAAAPTAPSEETAARSLEETVAADPLVVALEATRAEPGAWDDGIVAYLDEWAVEFADDDAGSSVQRAHRMWWNSGLDRDAFHRAMKRAYYATRSRQRQSAINGPPTAYLFGVLAGAIADERMKLGLPLAASERDALAKRAAPPDGKATGRGKPQASSKTGQPAETSRKWRVA